MQPGDDRCLMLVLDFAPKKLSLGKRMCYFRMCLKNIGSNFNHQPPISTNKIEINHWLVLNQIRFQRHFGEHSVCSTTKNIRDSSFGLPSLRNSGFSLAISPMNLQRSLPMIQHDLPWATVLEEEHQLPCTIKTTKTCEVWILRWLRLVNSWTNKFLIQYEMQPSTPFKRTVLSHTWMY